MTDAKQLYSWWNTIKILIYLICYSQWSSWNKSVAAAEYVLVNRGWGKWLCWIVWIVLLFFKKTRKEGKDRGPRCITSYILIYVPELYWDFSFQFVKTNWFMPLEFLSHKLLEQQADICFQVRQRLSSYAYSYAIYLPGLEKRNQHKSKQPLQKITMCFFSQCARVHSSQQTREDGWLYGRN